MSKKYLWISFLTAALLPWLLFSDALHDNISRLFVRVGTIFSANDTHDLVRQTQVDMVEIKGGSFYFGRQETQEHSSVCHGTVNATCLKTKRATSATGKRIDKVAPMRKALRKWMSFCRAK